MTTYEDLKNKIKNFVKWPEHEHDRISSIFTVLESSEIHSLSRHIKLLFCYENSQTAPQMSFTLAVFKHLNIRECRRYLALINKFLTMAEGEVNAADYAKLIYKLLYDSTSNDKTIGFYIVRHDDLELDLLFLKMLNKLFNLLHDNQTLILNLLWSRGYMLPLSVGLFCRTSLSHPRYEQIFIEYLDLLQTIYKYTDRHDLIYRQFTTQTITGWCLLDAMYQSNDSKLIYHFIEAGFMPEMAYQKFKNMNLAVANYIFWQDEPASRMRGLQAMLDKQHPLGQYFEKAGISKQMHLQINKEISAQTSKCRFFQANQPTAIDTRYTIQLEGEYSTSCHL